MAGVDFDRKAFVPAQEQTPPPQARVLGSIILVIALIALVFLGYKLLSDSRPSAAATVDSQSLEAIQQQLAKMEKRLDQIERRRKPSAPESDADSSNGVRKISVEKPSPKKTVYTVAPSGGTKTQPPPTQPLPQPSTTASAVRPSNDAATADREAWQATTDRLADVVGVVGSQEGEISQTREELNALLAQTRRSAVQFELRRGSVRQSVGPLTMMLKGSDPRTQRYTVCVYIDDKCIELKDRTANEVVVFVVSRNSPPMELIATKVLRDQIVGYLEVPTEKSMP
jgi:hypothetical protein